jgi:hypothetical protein
VVGLGGYGVVVDERVRWFRSWQRFVIFGPLTVAVAWEGLEGLVTETIPCSFYANDAAASFD